MLQTAARMRDGRAGVRPAFGMMGSLVALVVPGILMVIGLLLILLRGWMWLRAPRRPTLCPGPRLSWRQRLTPLWLVFRPRCAYDLSGHLAGGRAPAIGGGAITCPECGRQVTRSWQLLRSPRAWRPAHLGVIFIIAGLLIYQYPPLSAMTVVQYTPTDILLRGEGILGVGTPLQVRDEIRRRAMDHQLTDPQISMFVRLLVNDLRNDGLSGNARTALEALSFFAVFDEQPLLDALGSDDAQQRQLAAQVLRSMAHRVAVSDEILQLAIDDLRADDIGSNARSAQDYLEQHLERAKPLLIKALDSDDVQQRTRIRNLLRSADLGGEALDKVIQIAVDDLASASQSKQSRQAKWYLQQHLERATPLLIEALHSKDLQQRRYVFDLLESSRVDAGVRKEMLERVNELIRLSVDQLRNDSVAGNARGAEFLLRRIDRAAPLLAEALGTSDRQQRSRVARLLRSAEIGGSVLDQVLEVAVDDLASDNQNGNAEQAEQYLRSRADQARPYLLKAMHSTDEQQRRAVLDLLRRTETAGETFVFLLQLSVDELRSTTPGSERTAFSYLIKHAAAAEPLLRHAMQGDDAMQRLLCAAAAGCAGHQPLIDLATPILISHLADNSIMDDATIAARGLWGFGREVLPRLEPFRSSPDEQQRQAIEYIIQRMTTDKSLKRLERELPGSRLTGASFDTLTVDPQRLKIPHFTNERLAGAGAKPSGSR